LQPGAGMHIDPTHLDAGVVAKYTSKVPPVAKWEGPCDERVLQRELASGYIPGNQVEEAEAGLQAAPEAAPAGLKLELQAH
jgi:hypothetical protein